MGIFENYFVRSFGFVYEELGGDPFFFNTVDEFHSFTTSAKRSGDVIESIFSEHIDII